LSLTSGCPVVAAPGTAVEEIADGGAVTFADPEPDKFAEGILRSLETDPSDSNTVVNPSVVVEVLSDSTESYDRGEKFENYKRIPSLKEYVLVSQDEPFTGHLGQKPDLLEQVLPQT